MKANAPAARNSPATGEQNTVTQQRVTIRNVVDETGEVETIYRVDGRCVHRRAVLYIHRRCRGCLGESVGHNEWLVNAWELLDHLLEYRFTRGLPVDYEPDAEPEDIDEFMDDIVRRREDKRRMYEVPGPTLSRSVAT